MRKSTFLILVLVAACLTAKAQDEKFKALFMYNFTKYIEWPQSKQTGDFVIGVVGGSPIIDELNAKNYQNLKAFDTPNFVLMFIPVESSFSTAVQIDKSLYNYALQRNVVMVTPSTLLATLRTVASIWQHEKQNRNTLEIARMSGRLYDKLCGFISDMEKIDKALKSAQSSYNDAVSKLSTGTGNAIATAEKIKKLGAKTTKSISSDYLLTEEGEELDALPEAKKDEV